MKYPRLILTGLAWIPQMAVPRHTMHLQEDMIELSADTGRGPNKIEA